MWPVRWLHLSGAALAVGGAALIWTILHLDSQESLHVTVVYELLFWGAISILAMTGVGNLGEFAPGIPPIGTQWGQILALKLLAVLVLLVGSTVRTVLVLQITESSIRTTDSERRSIRLAYAGTAIWLLVILVFAEVLAHG